MATAILLPVSVSDPNSNIDSGDHTDINNGVDTPQDGTGVASITDNFNPGVYTFQLSNVPGNFDSLNSARFRVRGRVENPGSGDTMDYICTLVGAALPATTIAQWDETDAGGGLSNRGAASLESTSATEANVNAWTVEVSQANYVKDMGADGINFDIGELEVAIDYNLAGPKTAFGSPSISAITSAGTAEVVHKASGVGGNTVVATEDFSTANDPLSNSADWAQAGAGFFDSGKATGGAYEATNTSNDGSAATWTSDVFADDQYAEAVIGGTPGAASDWGILLRCADADPEECLLALFLGGSNEALCFYLDSDGLAHQVGSTIPMTGGVPALGDSIRAEVRGNILTSFFDFGDGYVEQGSWDVIASGITGGSPGLFLSDTGADGHTFDDWEGGNLSGDGPTIAAITAAGDASVAESVTTADGSPSITPIESFGDAEVIRTADGSPSITPLESTGVVEIIRSADGSPSITPIESTGVVEVIRAADGSPSISQIESTGVAEIIRDAQGNPSISKITSTGVAEIVREAIGVASISPITSEGIGEIIRTAIGATSIAKATSSGSSFIWPKVWLNTTETLVGATEMTVTAASADGTSITFDDEVGAPFGSIFLGVENRSNGDVGWIAVTVSEGGITSASGSPSISAIVSSGDAEVIRTAVGSPSISPITSDGDVEVIRAASGSPSVSPITSTGAAEITRAASGSPSISPITSDGVVEIIRTALGSPSIAPITSEGAAEIIRTALGSPSISKITGSGTSFIWPKVYLNTTETLIGATEMTVTAVAIDGTSITFNDPPGTPIGSVFLGVENRSNGDVGWIAVTVAETIFGPTIIFGGFGA